MKGQWRLVLIVVLISLLCFTGCTQQQVQAPDSVPDATELVTESADDQKLEDILSQYTFYQGLATVMEDQKWTAKGTDGSHGEGSGVLTSEDYLVYDDKAQNLYIVARNMTYTSNHTVTVNDVNGNYLDTAYVNAEGELQEFYSWGLLVDGKLSFSALPIRADGETQEVFSRPDTLNQQWVAYTSTADTVRLGVDRVMPPDVSVNSQLSQLPVLESLSDSKSYGNKDVYAYEATTRLWQLKGTFDYAYKKITLAEMLAGVNGINEAKASGESFSKRVDMLPEAWQVTAVMGDQLMALADASASIQRQTKGAEAALASNGNNAEGVLQALQNQPEFTKARKVIESATSAEADQSAPRSLEGVIIETGDAKLLESQGPFLKAFDAVLKAYGEKGQQFEDAFKAFEEQKNTDSFADVIGTAEALSQESLMGISGLEVFEDKVQQALVGNALLHLDGLYRQWTANVTDSLGKETAVNIEGSVALPTGYPVGLLPMMPEARAVISEIIPAEGDLKEGYMVSCVVQAKEEAILAYYGTILGNMEGYEVTGFGTMKVLNAISDTYAISVLITPNTLGGTEPMMIQISLMDKDA